MKYASIWLVPMILFTIHAYGELIPADRLITWQGNVGVEGGIPVRTTQIDCTAAPYNAHANGVDTSSNIQACLNGISSGQAAYLPAGTYTMTSSVSMPSNKTLRGAGPDKTILLFTTSLGGDITIIGGYTDATVTYWYPSFNILSGYTKGSNQLTLSGISSGAATIAPGSFVYISELNDQTIPVTIADGGGGCTYCGLYGANGTRARIQLSKVTAVNQTTITISPAMLFSFSSGNLPQVTATPAYVQYAGIEDLAIKNGGSTLTTNTGRSVWFQGAANSWVKNVKMENCGTRCVHLWDDVYRNEVRDCYFKNVIDQVNSDRYAVEVWGGTGNLIENNIFDNTANGIVLTTATGNVFAYNYMHGVHRTAGLSDWFWPDTWAHGSHCSYNLWEGNDGNALEWDPVHGSNSHNLAFRNRFRGVDATVTYDLYNLQAVGAIHTYVFNNYMTSIGNVLGTTGFSNLYEGDGSVGTRPVWRTVRSYGGATSDLVFTTSLRHMNYDYVTNSVKRCGDAGEPGCQGSDAGTILPASFYLAGKPSWFGTVSWPPIGPDVAGLASDIPAKICYQNTEAKGISFNANACYYGAAAILYGDVSENGAISSYDASLAAQYSVGLITLTASQLVKADVSGNGSVTSYDASLIAQYAVGLITKFPVSG